VVSHTQHPVGDRCTSEVRHGAGDPAAARRFTRPSLPRSAASDGGEVVIPRPVVWGPMAVVLPRSCSPVSPGRFGRATADYVDRLQAALGPVIGRERRRVRPVIAPPPDDPTPITQVKVRTRAKSTTGFSLSKPVPGFKTGYRLSFNIPSFNSQFSGDADLA